MSLTVELDVVAVDVRIHAGTILAQKEHGAPLKFTVILIAPLTAMFSMLFADEVCPTFVYSMYFYTSRLFSYLPNHWRFGTAFYVADFNGSWRCYC